MRAVTPTIDDLITRGVPGVVLFLAVTFEFFQSTNGWLEPNAKLVIVLTGSYTVGTFIDVHKHDVFSPPPFFRKVLYEETGNPGFLRLTTRAKLRLRQSRGIGLWNDAPILPEIETCPDYGRKSIFSKNGGSLTQQLETTLGEDVTPNRLTHAWTELERQALPELGRTGQNHHTVYHFILNLAIGITFGSLLLLFPLSQGKYVSVTTGALITAFFALLLMVELSVVGKYGTRYAKSLVQGMYLSSNPSTTRYPVSS